jgi:hypothetical protein
MAALVGKRVRTIQPQPGEALLIDWSNPITRDMVLAFSHAEAAYGYCASGQTLVPYVAATQVNTILGAGARSASTSSRAYNLSVPGLTGTNYSLFAVGSATSNAVTQIALDCDNNATRKFQFRIANGKAEFIPFNTSAGTTGVATSPVAMSLAELTRGFTIGATASPIRTAVFQNGQVTTNTPTNLTALNGTVYVGARWAGDAGWATGALSMVAAWARTLTDAEMQSLADNPWQLFKPLSRRLWVPRAPLAAYVLQAASGAFAWLASQAALIAARRLVTAVGALTSGWTPGNLRVSRRLSGDVGGFTMSGTSASIAAARKIAASVGAFGMAGKTAPLIVARRLPAQTGTFTLSPGSVQMAYTPVQGPSGPTYTLTATVGTFALTAAVVGVLAWRRLSATSAAFAWSGTEASLLAGRRMLADAGAFVLAGVDAQLRYSAQVSYARAPVGAGYAPQQHYNEARPSATGAARPNEAGPARLAATQRNFR